jgi:hypothetical protein
LEALKESGDGVEEKDAEERDQDSEESDEEPEEARKKFDKLRIAGDALADPEVPDATLLNATNSTNATDSNQQVTGDAHEGTLLHFLLGRLLVTRLNGIYCDKNTRSDFWVKFWPIFEIYRAYSKMQKRKKLNRGQGSR